MLKKQNIFAILIFLFLCPFLMKAQEEKPILLPIPADWKYEKIDFPLDFAPEAASKGFEELRFAPGIIFLPCLFPIKVSLRKRSFKYFSKSIIKVYTPLFLDQRR